MSSVSPTPSSASSKLSALEHTFHDILHPVRHIIRITRLLETDTAEELKEILDALLVESGNDTTDDITVYKSDKGFPCSAEVGFESIKSYNIIKDALKKGKLDRRELWRSGGLMPAQKNSLRYEIVIGNKKL